MQEPTPGKLDPHMVTAAYNPSQVYNLHVPQGQTAQIVFAPTEAVVNCFGFDNTILRVFPTGNIAAIWGGPHAVQPRTVFFVTRTAEGSLRTYAFLIDTQPRDAADYSMTFTYPGDIAAYRAAVWRRQQAQREQRSAEAALAAASGAGDSNFKYVLQGKAAADWNLLPTREVSDNGTETHFHFPGNMRMPIIYAVNQDGKEAIVDPTFDSRTGTATVHQLAPEYHLRDGDALLCVFNRAFDPVGVRIPTNTVSSGVERITR
jgi:type IV secretion system protein VirB9